MAERGKGRIKAVVVPDTKSKAVLPIVEETVEKGSKVYTDEYDIYNRLRLMGYGHFRVLHNAKVYVSGNVHTNTIEGFWSLVKTGIRGIFIIVALSTCSTTSMSIHSATIIGMMKPRCS